MNAVILNIHKDSVLAGDVSPVTNTLTPKRFSDRTDLAATLGSCFILVSGYDDHPEEVYAIDEIRDYYLKLSQEWPYAAYFLHIESLRVYLSCLCANFTAAQVKGSTSILLDIDPKNLTPILKRHFFPMLELMELAGYTSNECNLRMNEIMESLALTTQS